MLYPELNGPIGLSPEYKRLILPNIRAFVKAYSVRSESFFGSFFVFDRFYSNIPLFFPLPVLFFSFPMLQ